MMHITKYDALHEELIYDPTCFSLTAVFRVIL